MFARGLAFGLVSTLLVHGQIKASVSSNTEPGRKQALDAVKCLVKDRGARGLASAGNGGYYDDADDIGAYDFDDQGMRKFCFFDLAIHCISQFIFRNWEHGRVR